MTDAREFHDGREDGLVALESLDLDQVKSFAGLLRAMSKTAFSGRSLGEALDVTVAMVKDPDCTVVLTLSGAMTIAKMGKVISKMIDTGMVQAVVSTGALMAHGLSEAVGLTHYRHDPTDVGRGALRQGLQPRLRHPGDGVEPERRRGVHLEGPRPARRRAGAARARSSTARSARCWRRIPQAAASSGARTSRTCRSTSRRSPTPSWASTSRPGP